MRAPVCDLKVVRSPEEIHPGLAKHLQVGQKVQLEAELPRRCKAFIGVPCHPAAVQGKNTVAAELDAAADWPGMGRRLLGRISGALDPVHKPAGLNRKQRGAVLIGQIGVVLSGTGFKFAGPGARAVETLASLGMVEGVGGGKFAPERTITRAEFTVMAMRFARLPEGGENPFSDVTSSDWFYDQVVGAVQYGWITGYTDGTFRPEATITRAEVTAITNRLLDRAADEDYVDDHAGELRQFPDVSASYWAYHDIVEATNAHSYRVYDGEEHWM